MSAAEDFRILLFIAVTTGIFVLAIGILVRRLFKRKSGPFSRTILALAGIGLLCMAYGRLVEPYWLSVSHVRVASSKLPKGSAPIRIVHLSDLHSDKEPRLETRLPAAIAEEHPDLIVFTGDSINSPEGLPVFQDLLRQISKIAPTFVVSGNWDSWYWGALKVFEGTGVQELNGTSTQIEVKGSPILIAGIAVEGERRLSAALDGRRPDIFTVFLYHYPDLIHEVSDRNVDLYLAGHTHGGQVALPLYGALITLSKYGKEFEAGLYQVKNTSMYVSRGIGMEGGTAPRVRFWSRPEIVSIDVVPAS